MPAEIRSSSASIPSPAASISDHRYHRINDGVRLVDDLRRSGLTQAAFAQQRGIGEKKVSYWVRRVRALTAVPLPPVPPTLVQVATISAAGLVTVESPAPTALVEKRSALGEKRSAAVEKMPAALLGPVAVEIRFSGVRSIAVGAGCDRATLRAVIELMHEVEA